jgi:hypothetical protein
MLDVDVGPRVLAHHPGDRHAGIGGSGAELPAVARRRIFVREEPVQVRRVRRVDADLGRLQPVAVPVALERERVRLGGHEAVEARERRRLAFAEVREEDPAPLHHRMRARPHLRAERAAVRLGGRLEASTRDVEQPAMKPAPQAAVLEPPVREVRAAMRTVALQETAAPALVAEQHEVLAEQPHRLDRARARELLGERGRLPVAAQELPGPGAGPDAGHELVLRGADHRAVEDTLAAAAEARRGVVRENPSLLRE